MLYHIVLYLYYRALIIRQYDNDGDNSNGDIIVEMNAFIDPPMIFAISEGGVLMLLRALASASTFIIRGSASLVVLFITFKAQYIRPLKRKSLKIPFPALYYRIFFPTLS